MLLALFMCADAASQEELQHALYLKISSYLYLSQWPFRIWNVPIDI